MLQKIFKSSYLYIGLIFMIISLAFIEISFRGLTQQQFLYIGDQFFRFNFYETWSNAFFIRKADNLGVHNGWQFTTQYWDVLYYFIVYIFNLNFILAEKILFGLAIFLSLSLSFGGFSYLSKQLKLEINLWVIMGISVWYIFNPYTLALWHGGVYNLGLSFTYSLAPLLFGLLYQSLFNKSHWTTLVVTALVIYLSAFTFWLFAPLVLGIVIFFSLMMLFNLNKVKQTIIHGLIIVGLSTVLVSPILYSIFYEMLHNYGNNNTEFMPTFGNQIGGLKYQLLMRFSWAIYNVWNPRTLYPFHEYFFSIPYKLGIYSFYGLIGVGLAFTLVNTLINVKQLTWRIIKLNTRYKLILGSIMMFGVAVFLAKAAQPPAGEIFIWLYDNLPFFSIFRTADIRFGFLIVFSAALLLLFAGKHFNKILFNIAICLIIWMQVPSFISTAAIQGQNVPTKFFDRVIEIPADYQQLAAFLNTNNSTKSYVLALPPLDYGIYYLPEDKHLGQDILPKIINSPFIYLTNSNGINSQLYNNNLNWITNQQLEMFTSQPYRYLLIRRDIDCPTCLMINPDSSIKLAKVFENSTFSLYLNHNFQPEITGVTAYQKLNPVTYDIEVKDLKSPQKITLNLSPHPDWQLYLEPYQPLDCLADGFVVGNTNICPDKSSSQWFWNIQALFKKPLPKIGDNQWLVEPQKNQPLGSNLRLKAYYQPQSLSWLLYVISYTSLAILVVLVLRYYWHEIINKKVQ